MILVRLVKSCGMFMNSHYCCNDVHGCFGILRIAHAIICNKMWYYMCRVVHAIFVKNMYGICEIIVF